VGDYLERNAGISSQAIEIGGKGEAEPLVGCEGVRGTAAIECLAPNRRAEIVFDVF
jgi:OOP family OmpA-OmpF porin